jgi:hypothetical protein
VFETVQFAFKHTVALMATSPAAERKVVNDLAPLAWLAGLAFVASQVMVL